MTERVPVTDALPHQDATLEELSLATNSTAAQELATNETTPSESESSGPAPAPSEQDVTQSQNHLASQSKAVVASSNFIWYRSASVQTLPPGNAEEFRKIYDREPTNQELVSKIGSAAIGRYVPGPSANPHDVILGKPSAMATVPERRPNYTDSSFQTDDAAQCRKALLRAKVKATLLVNRQRNAAQLAGFKIWSETRDEFIVHSEQLPINIQFDTEGNAIDANVDGLSLPNISGEEIKVGKEAKDYASSASLNFTPPPTPPSEPVQDAFYGVGTPQRIRTLEPHVPSDKSDPVSIEWYGYIERVPIEATERSNNEEQEQAVLAIGGERFADEYIVYDATVSTPSNYITTSDTNSDTSRKRNSEDEEEPETAASSSRRFKTSPTRDNSLEPGAIAHGDGLAQQQAESAEENDAKGTHKDRTSLEIERGQSSTLHRMYEDKGGAKHEQNAPNSPAQRGFRRRSPSPGDGSSSIGHTSGSSVGRQSEDRHEEERQRDKVASEVEDDSRTYVGNTHKQIRAKGVGESDVRMKDTAKTISARKQEDDRKAQRAQHLEEEERAQRQKQEESEVQRAREAKNQRKLEIEEKKRAQEADSRRRREEKDEDRRRRRDDSRDTSRKARQRTAKQEEEPSEPMDPYAAARQAEARRRELLFAAREAGETDGRTRERSPARDKGLSKLDVKRPEPEKKVEEKKPAKKRPSRTARGELERYDPRKKFGGGK